MSRSALLIPTLLLTASAWPLPAQAQDTVAQPGDEAAGRSHEGQAAPAEQGRVPSYEAVAVAPAPPGALREEQRIGEYVQPRWTAHRRFPTTRVYVRPRGEIGFEWWLESKFDLSRELHDVRYRSQYEFEFGMGYRLQMDLYLTTEQLDHQAPFYLHEEKVELRWALANWGVIPTNPTLYVEFARVNDGPPVIEGKILLGEELTRRVHWGFNLVAEHQLGAERENEYAVTTAFSFTILDEVLSLGIEIKFETVDSEGNRWSFDNYELLSGPSLSWAPTAPMHILFLPLFGFETELDTTTGESSTVGIFEPTIIVGWEFS